VSADNDNIKNVIIKHLFDKKQKKREKIYITFCDCTKGTKPRGFILDEIKAAYLMGAGTFRQRTIHRLVVFVN
jgi:hypothetical protein